LSHSALIKVGRIYSGELPDEVPAGRCRYQRGSIRFLPNRTVPVLVDHNDHRRIGTVLELAEIEDTDGHWMAARCELSDVPSWLKGGLYGTRASWGYKVLRRQQIGEWERIHHAIIDEVSVLLTQTPREPCAQVLTVSRREEPAAGRTSDRPAAGNVVTLSDARSRRARSVVFTDDEIRRRLDEAGRTGHPRAIELELEHLRRLEGVDGNSIHEAYREHLAAKAAVR
jgi:hypothetical protein